MPNRHDPVTGLARRGTSNGNQRGSAESRRNRKLFLLKTYPADVRGIRVTYVDPAKQCSGYYPPREQFDRVWTFWVLWMKRHRHIARIEEVPCTRCYRCGCLLTFETMTVDRITPGCKRTAKYPRGGTYVRENIRPACGGCNSDTGGRLAKGGKEKPIRLDVKVVRLSLCGRFSSAETIEYAPPAWEQKSA